MKYRTMIKLAAVLLFAGLVLFFYFILSGQGGGSASNEIAPGKTGQAKDATALNFTPNSSDGPSSGVTSKTTEIDMLNAPERSPGLLEPAADAGVWDSGQSLSEIFQETADRYGWSPEVRHANQVQWTEPCRSVDQKPKPGVTLRDLNLIDPYYVTQQKFREICGFLMDETELTTMDNLLDERESVDAAVAAEMANLRQRASLGDAESTLELAAELLLRALESRDEHFIRSTVNLIAFNELLNPFIVEGDANYKVVYKNLTRQVSSTLLCRRIGGCRGAEHPFVMRECVTALRERGAYCVRPANIEEAIYQTLTPIGYQAYLSFVDQVDALVRSHR